MPLTEREKKIESYVRQGLTPVFFAPQATWGNRIVNWFVERKCNRTARRGGNR